MQHPARTLTPLITAVALAVTLAGCSDGPSDSADAPTTKTSTPAATTPTAGSGAVGPTAPAIDQPQSPAGLRLDARGCPILPHGWNLCAENTEDPTWSAPLKKDGHTWLDWVSVGFFSDGTMTWREQDAEATSTGTWKYDGAGTVVIHFDAAVPMLGTDTLSLKVDEFRRGCGDPLVYYRWDALTSTRPALRFEPIAC